MNKFDFLLELQKIDDNLIDEITNSRQTIKYSRLRIAIIAAAVLTVLSLVACSILVARSEIFLSDEISAVVHRRIKALSEPIDIDNFNEVYLSRYDELLAEYDLKEEDIVVKTYDEYIRNGYYFDEVVLVTKDTAIGRIITDADKFKFDVEFTCFFYNERTDEFKTITQTTSAQGGKIEIIMDAEHGWECFGGLLARTHPESEYEDFNGVYIQKYGIEPSVRAMQFMDKHYFDELKKSPSIIDAERKRITNTLVHGDTQISEDTFASTESDDPLARILQVTSNYEMEGISNAKTYYDKQSVSDEEFIEAGYAYNDDVIIAFANNTIESATINLRVVGIFYNAKKDQYRISYEQYNQFTNLVIRMEAKKGWKCIGISMSRTTPESDVNQYIEYNDFNPVEGDEADSREFWEKVMLENNYIMELNIRLNGN